MYETQGSKQQQGSASQQGGQQGREQQSREQQGRGQQQRQTEHTLNMAELALRGTGVLFDIQMAAVRSLWHLQTRSAAAFGAPDYSDLLRFTDVGAKRLLSTGAEQVLTSARQASDTITELQRQFGRLVEQGALQLTEEMRQGMEELNERTQQGLQEVKNLAQQGADEAERMTKERESALQQQRQQAGGRPGEPQIDQPRPQTEQPRAEEEKESASKQRRSA
ncbi:MAG TPA: hypothetical protein VM532_18290 [Burkholderiales bacterium]|nr:hypothetical protein [Burkholderiales bacterium]